MMELAKSKNDIPLEASIPGAPLESILRTEEFHGRPCRPPDYEKENRALGALMSALVDSPGTILQTLAEKVLEALPADSAGLSLLTKDEKSFYWPAIAGAWQPHIGGGTARDFGPCGDVLDRNVAMLFTHWERRYPYLRPATPLAEEGLLVPFYVNGKAVGTIWAIAHNDRRKFDAEDLRLLESLGRFASAAYQAVASIDDLKFQIVEREKAETAVRELATGLQAKIRCLVDSNIIGIVIWDLDGRITDANDAFLHMVGYDREDLVAGRIRWTDLTPPEWLDRDARQLVPELKRAGILLPFEKEYFRKDGSRVPVLIGVASFEVSGNEGVAFVLDLSERKRAEAEARESERRYREIQMELAHANRVATMGQLTASIAHEVKQPIAATVSNAQAALRWLAREPPELDEVRQALASIVKDGKRAGDVVGGIRDLIKKAPSREDRFDINAAIREVIELTRAEAVKTGVTVRMELANGLALIQGDRVQLQQVLLNLIINAIEAMSGASEGARELLVSTGKAEAGGVLIAVRDSGPGLAPTTLDRLFEPFYSTKSSGLGLGLSICRSIIEAHGGRLWTSTNVPRGAIFQFTVPEHPEIVPGGRGRQRVTGGPERDGKRIERARPDIAEHDADRGEHEEEGAALVPFTATGGTDPRSVGRGALGIHGPVSLRKAAS
jgi:PAS domain S-box-containing protein